MRQGGRLHPHDMERRTVSANPEVRPQAGAPRLVLG
jgi:hypothetical protein